MIINKLSIKKFCQSFVRNGKSQKSIDNVFDKIDNSDNQALTKSLSTTKKADKLFLTILTNCKSMRFAILSVCQTKITTQYLYSSFYENIMFFKI